MIVYFVRHGESEGNAANQHQTPETPLSQIGQFQATRAAHRFKHIPVEVILSSDYIRTLQTATAINTVLQKQIVPTPLLRELRRPSEMVGRTINDPAVVKIKQLISDHQSEPEWHYSNEENYFDFSQRARACLRMIGDREESKILCVTHGFVLCMLISTIIFGDQLTPALFETMYH